MVLKAKSEKEETERSEGGWSSKDGGVRNCFLKFKGMWRQSWRPGESEDKRQAWRLRERRAGKQRESGKRGKDMPWDSEGAPRAERGPEAGGCPNLQDELKAG